MSRVTSICAAVAVAVPVGGALSMPVQAAERVEVPPTPPVSSIAGDAFFAYDRPATFRVHRQDVRVPMRDGSHLACRLHRPATKDGAPAPGRFPGIVYEYTAYADQQERFAEGLAYFVERGYEGVICQVRGSGKSPGVVDPFGPQEQRDNVDLIEWLAKRKESTGKIGQMGLSYGGHATLLAAVNRPKHLTAVIAINGIHDWYENTIYRGGIPSPRIKAWQKEVAPNTLKTYAEHPLYDQFWRARSVMSRWDSLTIPTLEINGWYDRYRDGMVKNYQARPDNVWMVSGPWEHGYPNGQPAPIDQRPYLAWWDHWLKGDSTARLPRQRITSFEISSDNRSTGWHQFASWPPSVRTEQWTANRSGALGPKAGAFGAESFTVNTATKAANASQRIDFTSAPVRQHLVLAGSPVVDAAVTFTADDGNIAAVLEDVAPDGKRTRITNGWLRASHRDGHTSLSAVEPGRRYDLRVQLWPTHYRVPVGHRLSLRLSSDDYPEIASDAPAGNVEVLVGQGNTSVSLPLLK